MIQTNRDCTATALPGPPDDKRPAAETKDDRRGPQTCGAATRADCPRATSSIVRSGPRAFVNRGKHAGHRDFARWAGTVRITHAREIGNYKITGRNGGHTGPAACAG